MSMDECDFRKTYTYRHNGTKYNSATGESDLFGPRFGNGDVVGCGWDKYDDHNNISSNIFFTLNGKWIGKLLLV
jgi:hypothetical protein